MAEKVMVYNILKSLKSHTQLIAGMALLCMAGIWVLLAFIFTPNYQAASQLYVDPLTAGMSDIIYLEKKVDPQVLNASEALIKSSEVLSSAIASTGSKMTAMELSEKVTVSNVPASQVLSITVEERDSKTAAEMANALADAAVIEAWQRMKVDNLSVIAKASAEEVPSVLEENLLYVLAIGGFIGTIVGVLLAFIMELFNMLFRTGILTRKKKRSDLQSVFK